jgi:hypothetical protein
MFGKWPYAAVLGAFALREQLSDFRQCHLKFYESFFRYALVLSSGGAIAEFIGVPQNGHFFSKARLLSEM